VLRYTPGGTTESTSATTAISVTSGTLGRGLMAVFANIRNNSTTTSFLVRAQLITSGTSKSAYTPLVYVAPYVGSAGANWVFLGLVAFTGASFIKISATASAAAGSIDFGATCVVDVLYPSTHIFTYQPQTDSTVITTVEVNHASLTLPQPYTSGGGYNFNTSGNISMSSIAQNVAMVTLVTSPANDDWRQNNGAGAVNANTFDALRYSAYLSPD
jgi:hypothetical protein